MTPTFLVRDRVAFRAGHPWYGYSGVVREVVNSRSFGLGWHVEVEGQYGLRAFAQENELRLIERTTEGD